MIAVLLLWAAVLPPALAAGAWLLARCDREHTIGRAADRLLLGLWLGLIAMSLFLLPVAWWRPLTPAVYGAACVLVLGAGWRELGALLRDLSRQVLPAPRWPMPIALSVATLAVAIYATRPITIYDTGLYHYPLIHWLAEVGLPRGLALIHSRFGFQPAWFTIPAALDHGFLAGRVAGLMGSLGLLLLVVHWLVALDRCLRGRAVVADRFAAWGLAGLLAFVAGKAWLISPSPDVPVAAAPLLLVWLWLLAGRSTAVPSVAFALSLGVLALKLSALPLLAVTGAACVSSPALRRNRRVVVALLAGAALVAVIVVASSLITSGCLYYPVGASCLRWPWSISGAVAAQETQQVVQYARWAGAAPDVAGHWFPVWLRAHDFETAIGVLGLLVLIWRLPKWRAVPGAGLAVATVLAGIAFGMIAAPDPRFWAGHLFALFGLAAWSLGRAGTAGSGQARSARGTFAGASATMPVVALLLLAMAIAGREHKRVTSEPAHAASFWAMPAPLPTPWRGKERRDALVEARTDAGLNYLHPRDGDQCWDAPLPCAPRALDVDVRQRDPQRGAAGGFERAR